MLQHQGLTMGAACELRGCDKPISARNRVACGELHHILIMAQRYHLISNTSASPRTLAQQTQLLEEFSRRQSEGLCSLSSCSKPAYPGHTWCSRRHYLEWLAAFYRSLVPDQICKLRPECTRHVFVDVNERNEAFHAHPYCGWTHCQEYQKRLALRNILQAPAPPPQLSTSDEVMLDRALRLCYNFLLYIKGFYRCEPSEESLIKALIDLAAFGMTPKGINVMEDFYTKHPWEVLQQYQVDGCCFLIARCLYKGNKEQKRELTTKEEYHWKQQGRQASVGAEASKKYFRYTKLQGKKRTSSGISMEDTFTMVEYCIVKGEFYDKCKGYTLIKLSTSKPQRAARKRARKEVEADEAESNTLPPDNAAAVADQACDLYRVCSEQGRDGSSLDAWEALSFTGAFDSRLLEGLDSCSAFGYGELEAMDDIPDSLSAYTNPDSLFTDFGTPP